MAPQKENFMNQQMSRRQALKMLMAGAAGIAVAPVALESCSGGSKKPAKSADPSTFGKIITRKWDALGGKEVGVLGMGCMRFPQSGRNIDQEQVNAMVDYALEHGVNYFDTAPAYGQSETATGIALSRYPRESYMIATKMSIFGFGMNGDPLEQAKNMFATSLRNLQTDYVDFFLLHAVSGADDFQSRFGNNGIMDYILSEKAAGRIRHLGFSFHGTNDGLKELLALPYNWEFIQIQMNYVDWTSMNNGTADAKTLYNLCLERNIPVTVMEPILGGTLANVNDGLKEMIQTRRPDLSPAGAALTFAASFPNVLACLSGMSNMDQLTENVGVFSNFKPFNDADNQYMLNVARLYRENPHIGCTGCKYCMPCPFGIDIPGNFAVYNEASDALSLPDPNGEKDKDYNRKRRRFIARYDSAVPEKARAEFCTQCRQCVQKCPQRIDIPRQLNLIEDLVGKLRES